MLESLVSIENEANPGEDVRGDSCKLPKSEKGDALCQSWGLKSWDDWSESFEIDFCEKEVEVAARVQAEEGE